MEKILLLGGSAQQIVAIETAKRLGYYTIVCDYLEDNPGQYVADKFYLLSTTDKEAILEVALKEKIGGVLAYASDPAAPTAAYVAEKMNLPTNPLQSVDILCNKARFREFLLKNGFNSPYSESFSDIESARARIPFCDFPVIIKPVDSSGSKGITVLTSSDLSEEAISNAFSYSRSKRIIIEKYLEKKHKFLVGGDIFVLDGKVILWGLLNCHRDYAINPLVPVGKSYPLDISEEEELLIKNELQRLINILGIRFGALNVEVIIDSHNKVWFIDVGPRNGGNMIPDLLGYIYDVDVVEMIIKSAMGITVDVKIDKGIDFYATYNIHSSQKGEFKGVKFSEEIERFIIKRYIYKKEGDIIERFNNAAHAVGIVFMKFERYEQMHEYIANIENHIKVELVNYIE